METIIGTDIQVAADLLRKGELVGIPTETVYGLAANALDSNAVLKIFEAKNRPAFDPLIVHIAEVSDLEKYSEHVPALAFQLAEAFWPGPLTILLPKQAIIPDLVTSGLSTVALRIPAHPMTSRLLQTLNFPLAAPSANLFGRVSPTRATHVKEQLEGRVPYILDGGDCQVGLESTIVGFPPDSLPTVYRLGGTSVEEIQKVIGEVRIMPHSSSNPQAPGMLKSHYAPGKPLYIKGEDTVLPDSASLLRYRSYAKNIPIEHQRVLSETGDLREAARNLFAYLRELDQQKTSVIIAELLPEEGLGKAINDRIRRASVPV